MKKISLLITMLVSTAIFGAAYEPRENLGPETPANRPTIVQITIGNEILNCDKNVLLEMPYFRARLLPARYMRAIPAYKEQINIIKRAEQNSLTPNSSLPEGTDQNDFRFLYHELNKILNEKPPITLAPENAVEKVLTEIKHGDYATPERLNSIINLAQQLLTLPPILPVLDAHWISMVQQSLSEHDGVIAKALFAPQENWLKTILGLIKAEKQKIKIACYMMTQPEIICELGRAAQRGVQVIVIVDRNNAEKKYIEAMHNAGLRTYLWRRESPGTQAKMHNKFFIFKRNINDQQLLVTGSANCTWSAQEVNEENVIILNDPKLLEAFENEFRKLKRSSILIKPADSEAAHRHIALNCMNMGTADTFTPHASLLFKALVRLYREYIDYKAIDPYGISIEAGTVFGPKLIRQFKTEWCLTKGL